MRNIRDSKTGLIFCLIATFQTAVVLLSSDQAFFWDTIQLASKHAHFYYENELAIEFLPDAFNSGHIPGFGYYLATCWTIFGKSLWVSHISMLPFVLLYAFSLSRILTKIESPFMILGALFILLDPTWLAQLTLVSPDVVLMSGLMLLIAGHIKQKSSWVILASILLVLVSIRGIFCFAIYSLLSLYLTRDLKKLIRQSLPAASIVLLFYGLHYIAEGWIGVHEDSPWKESLTTTNLMLAFKNMGLVVWRLIDFGRILWTVPLIILLFASPRKYSKELQFIFYYGICLLIAFLLLTSVFQSLTSHRYYLPVIQIGAILFLALASTKKIRSRLSIIFMIGLMFSQLASHFIIYPRFIAQGWDASLAYLPAQTLFAEADAFVENRQIDSADVGTCFPLRGNKKYRLLTLQDQVYSDIDLNQNQYIIYSNIMNDFKEEHYSYLSEHWKVAYQSHKRGIDLMIYERSE